MIPMPKQKYKKPIFIQYPHPYSKTPQDIKIYAGRLILKLLTEERIGNKLYIDEFIWFLPFIKSINWKFMKNLFKYFRI